MNNLFFVLGFLSTLAAPLNNYSQPVQPYFQVDEKPKKCIKFTWARPRRNDAIHPMAIMQRNIV